MARSSVCTKYAEKAAISGLNDEGCSTEMIFVRSVADGNCIASEKCLSDVTAVIRAVEMSDGPFVVVSDVVFDSQW
jgi:hypothetical protein